MTETNEVILKYQKLFFDWQNLTLDELADLSQEMPIKMLRWAAMIHADNKTRENLLRLSKINIGEKTVINYGINLYSNEQFIVEIGNRCAIAANVSLITESGPNLSNLKDEPLVKNKFIQKGRIIIEDDVWIGHGSVIFPAVRIGRSSIIGAYSIVKKDTQPFSIIKPGKPVSIIKY